MFAAFNSAAGARETLVLTSQTIVQLRQSLRDHVEQDDQVLANIQSLKKQLSEAEERHNDIQGNVATINEFLRQMEVKEQKLQSDVAPIRKLSTEMLLRIFQYSVHDADMKREHKASQWRRTLRFAHPFLLLGRVCSRWRSIVTQSPSLWETVEVVAGKLVNEHQATEQKRVAHWMKPGGVRNRRLFLCDWTPQNNRIVQDFLRSHLTIWKSIHVCSAGIIPGTDWHSPSLHAEEVVIYGNVIHVPKNLTPLMRSASTLTIYGPQPQWSTPSWINLRSLTLKGAAMKPGTGRQSLPFGAVQLAALLSVAPELTELVLDFAMDEVTSCAPITPKVVHGKLETLSLHLNHFVIYKGPFGVNLIAPCLKTLRLLSLTYKASVDLVPFTTRWGIPGTLILPPIEEREVVVAVELFKWLPKVHTLKAQGRNMDALFTFMNSHLLQLPPTPDSIPLPQLQTIQLTDTDLRGETLIEVLQRRMRHIRSGSLDVCAVTEIMVSDAPNVTVAEWHRLTALLEEAGRRRMIGIKNETT